MVYKDYVLIYDIPSSFPQFKVKINRELKKANATMLQKSVWKHNDLAFLTKIALLIKSIGGKAIVLEEKLVF